MPTTRTTTRDRTARLWWEPRHVLNEGKRPDYRFSLANERTFLAWLRTGLALIAGGIAADQLLPGLHRGVRITTVTTLIVFGALCAFRAFHHWARCEGAMRREEDLPVTRFPALLTLLIGVWAFGTAVVLFTVPAR
ncbi:YidH family protein [Streptomyces sp. NPDC057301]|uniref:YidH family protein n=1 Tax=Streptomyces sp. NPDC057301 TaxID=3346093 RepID=UPI00363A53D1